MTSKDFAYRVGSVDKLRTKSSRHTMTSLREKTLKKSWTCSRAFIKISWFGMLQNTEFVWGDRDVICGFIGFLTDVTSAQVVLCGFTANMCICT